MKKIITLTQLRRLNARVANGEISATKMVDIINQKALYQRGKAIQKFKEKQIDFLLKLQKNERHS